MEGHNNDFKSLFDPLVINIQNHGRLDSSNLALNEANDAYLEEDGSTFICSDLFRSQLRGFFQTLERDSSWVICKTDFSQTGAARSVSLDVKTLARRWFPELPFKSPKQFQEILRK